MRYLRPEETHKGKLVPARVETTVIYLPDVWSCEPTHLEWETMQLAYKKQLQKKLAQLDGKEDPQAEYSSTLSFNHDFFAFFMCVSFFFIALNEKDFFR